MNADLERMLRLVHQVQAAWDQYTVQQRLPEDRAWRTQGHPWDPDNRGHQFVPARRDPAAMSAAWNGVEEGLLELSALAERMRQGRGIGDVDLTGAAWHDRRMGLYTPAPAPLAPLPRSLVGARSEGAVAA